ncbi:unnamed protein product, partial [Vitis vinifera]
MAETCSRKLVVEICNAKNLMPKDGQGTASAYVIVDFDGQRRRTKTKFRDLNPQWDETLEFLVQDPESMASEILEINVYNDKKTGKRTTFLGKVKIAGSTFAKAGSEDLVYYPLEKRSVFSQIKGEIGLKISYVDEDVPPEPEKAAAEEKKPDEAAVAPSEQKTDDAAAAPAATEEKAPEKEEEKKADESNKEAADQKPAEPPKDEKAEEAPAAAASPPAEVENPPVAHTEKAIQTKETTETEKRPDLGVSDLELRSLAGDRGRRAYDLVDRMPFLYVRVVKAKGANSEAESTVYAKLVIGTHSVRTKSKSDKDWDQVFAFDKEGLNCTSLEVSVWVEKKDGENCTETSIGAVSFDLQEVPKRVPPDSPLAPQWYTLEDSSENSPGNDIMLAVWIGTQADEAFQEAWQSDSGGLIPETRAKVYLSPKLWYLRLTVIQSQDLQLGSGPEAKAKGPELYVKAQLGAQVFKTARTSIGSSNPTWNEDLLFVAAEPGDAGAVARWNPHVVLLSMDTRLSYAEAISADELDEEFDSFPTIKSIDQVRQRYDRLRILAGRAQTLLGDMAAQGERLEALFNWRDPRATGLFVVFCLVASLVFYTVPFRAFVLGWGFYYLRHPRFRGDMPSVPFNFFRRLPSLSDQIL